MPDIEWNKDYWNREYGWPQHGEEWSAQWGNSVTQWWGSIFPRIAAHLPAGSVVEIAPGQGRWSKFILNMCDTFVGYDISPATVEFCNLYLNEIGTAPHRSFFANSGADLPESGDETVDFVFSCDSLVHVEQDVIDGYVGEIARVLKPGGRAFLHHSNLGMFAGRSFDNVHCRGASVSAESVRKSAVDVGLAVPVQEMISWQSTICQDCFTTLLKPLTADPMETHVIYNDGFWNEAARLRDTLLPYNR